MTILSLIVLATYLIKSWKILSVLKTLLIVVAPVFIGLGIAWLFDPVVTWLSKRKVKRVFGTIIVYLLILGFFYLIVRLIFPVFVDQINDFVSSIPNILNYLKNFIRDGVDKIAVKSNYDLSSIEDQILRSVEDFGVSIATNLPALLMNVIRGLVSGGVTLVLGLMFGFYMLIDFNNVKRHLLNLIPQKWHSDATDLTNRVNQSLRSFVQGTLFIMLLVFVAQSIGLTIAGLEAPILFGLFCAITNVIPYLGPYIGGVPAVIVGFSISPVTGIGTLISIVVVQMIESYFLQPIVMGKTMRLHPVTIMVGLLIFQYFFGIIGMILATPIIASLKIIFQFIDSKLHFKKMLLKDLETEPNQV